MRKVSSREARKNFSDIINRARYAHEHTIIMSNGRQVAAIVSMQDLKIIRAVIEKMEDDADVALAKERLAEYERTGESKSWEEVKKELGW